MRQLLMEFGKKILYGFGFGFGMGIPYCLMRDNDNQEVYFVKLIKHTDDILKFKKQKDNKEFNTDL
jgi:hypothetical protein